jgi:hypothetical protein
MFRNYKKRAIMTKKNKVLYKMFSSIGKAYIKKDIYTINWNDGTTTIKSPKGKIITYKNK